MDKRVFEFQVAVWCLALNKSFVTAYWLRGGFQEHMCSDSLISQMCKNLAQEIATE